MADEDTGEITVTGSRKPKPVPATDVGKPLPYPKVPKSQYRNLTPLGSHEPCKDSYDCPLTD